VRTNKPYTNVTFTRRVDHEAGKHRAAKTPPGPRVCIRCGAVFERRRWTRDVTPVARSLRAIAAPVYTVCPACRQAAEGQFGGEVRISGSFFI
jgi:hypothetical protein